MLQIFDQNGNDLSVTPFPQMERGIIGGTTTAAVYAVVQDPGERVLAQIDWNDGSLPTVFPEQDSPIIINARRNLPFGTYDVTVTAWDTRAPTPDQVKAIFPWHIYKLNEQAEPTRILFGPILPRDLGLPNNQTWNFDYGTDLLILASNVKMLLLTAINERIMLPTYGTNLKRIIFELNVAAVETMIQQEIAQAIAAWEPRVTLTSIDVQNDVDHRAMSVFCTFLSRQNNQPFNVSLQYSQ